MSLDSKICNIKAYTKFRDSKFIIVYKNIIDITKFQYTSAVNSDGKTTIILVFKDKKIEPNRRTF